MNTLLGTELHSIPREECFQLLARHDFGRLAVTIREQPIIFPVNYALDGQTIVFRTDRGTKLYGADSRPVAFEVDGVDGDAWSVLVVGTAEIVTKEVEIRRLAQLTLESWNPAPKEHWVRIKGVAITGRRFAASERVG